MRAAEPAMMAAAEMHVAEAMPATSMATTVPMATAMSMAAAMPSAMAATMPTAASGDRVARQRHRKHHDRNSDCPSDHDVLPPRTTHVAATQCSTRETPGGRKSSARETRRPRARERCAA